ncbi:MAG: type II secretion system protein [Ruminococcus sp.]|nr:type II secretion system protein [Ruminococcus sp.]
MRKKKGFTLIELIIVIAILGVLLGLLAPFGARWLQRSRMRTQNMKAKAAFNAAQTIVTELEFHERKFVTLYKDPATSAAQKNIAVNHVYTPINGVNGETSSDWYYYYSNGNGFRCDANGNAIDYSGWSGRSAIMDEWNDKIEAYILRILGTDDITLKFHVDNYKITAVVSGNSPTDKYIGSHPKTLFELDDEGVDIDPIKNARVRGANLALMDLDPSNDAPASEDEETE